MLFRSGNNTYSGATQLQGGLVQLVGGNAIGDASIVTLADDRSNTLQLLANETLGGLSGGSATTGLSTLAQVDIGTYALTINQTTASQTYAGNVSGTGQIIKTGVGNAILGGTMTFAGDVIVNQGTLTLGTRTISNLLNVGTVTLNAGSMILDFNSGAEVGNKIRNDAPVVMINTGGIDGLRANHNRDDASKVEVVGALTFLGGANTLTASASATTGTTQRAMTITAASLVRSNQSTVLVRGQNLGTLTTTGLTPLHTGRVTATTAPTLFGAGGTSGTTFSILPWAIGDTDVAGKGSSFVTYGTNGFRPLDVGTEYEQLILTGGVTLGNNLRWASGTSLTLSGTTPRTLNSLLLQNTSTTDAITLNGAGASLNVQSGAFLALGTQGMTLTNFTGITTGSLNEYILHIVGTSAAGLMIEAPFTTLAASLTKSGEGTLVLKSTSSTYTGNTTINQGILEIDALNKLGNSGSGGIVINAGTLRFGAAFDASAVTITLGVPVSSTVATTTGGIFDTNGFDIVFANSVGNSGNGGLTKTGAGSLTLNAVAGYSGDTVLTLGTLIIGTNNAISGGNLTINGGATFALGTNSVNVGLVTTLGVAPGLTGTGSITSNKGFVFNHTGADPVIGAVLAGTGGVLKSQNVQLTLNGMNTYSGLTEVQNGGLVFNSVANVGSASALGRPMNAQDGMIRMGLTTAATSLTYTGTGHTTDRLIVLQGTTGTTTLNANGTGAVVYGGVKGFTPGIKALNLGGSSLSTVNNSAGLIEDGVAIVSIVKIDGNTWALTAANSYTGSTSIDGGTLRALVAQNLTGALQFGSTSATTTVGSLELNNASATFGSLIAQTNSANNSSLIIGAGRSLEITGNVTLGSAGATTTTLLTATGTGAFNVTNTTATGTTFLVGGSQTNLATADFSGLSTMNVSLNTTSGVLQVSSTSSTNSTGFATLNLAANTTITASALTVGGGGSYNGNAGQINQLRLGSGTNTLNVNALNVGTGSRDMGSLSFLGATGTVVVRAADGTSAALFNMGSGSSTTAAVLPTGNRNTFDVSGHTADLLFDAVSIGTQNGRTGPMDNLFAFNQGTLVMKTLTMGSKTAAGNSTNVMNLGGGTVTVGTGVAASTAVTLASNTSTGAVTSTVNITGGVVSVKGNILRGNQSGTGSATGTVNLDGGDLDMNGNVIGSAANPITFIAASGTLRNVATFNGTGGLNKTTTGRLVLTGVNAYTGGTTVSAGSLLVNNTTGSGTGTGSVSVAAASTLGGMGSISGSVTLNGILSPGAVDSGGNSLAGQLTVGTLTANTGSSLFLQVGGASVIDAASVTAYQANPSGFVVPTAWTNSYQAGVTAHDQINITGSGVQTLNTTVTISGNYLNGYTPGYGDVFHFVDWASLGTNNLAGTQSFVNLPVLSSGATWNTDYFSSHGIVFVVPEPSRMLLLLLGLLGLCVRRRRR